MTEVEKIRNSGMCVVCRISPHVLYLCWKIVFCCDLHCFVAIQALLCGEKIEPKIAYVEKMTNMRYGENVLWPECLDEKMEDVTRLL